MAKLTEDLRVNVKKNEKTSCDHYKCGICKICLKKITLTPRINVVRLSMWGNHAL